MACMDSSSFCPISRTQWSPPITRHTSRIASPCRGKQQALSLPAIYRRQVSRSPSERYDTMQTKSIGTPNGAFDTTPDKRLRTQHQVIQCASVAAEARTSLCR
jgi:hypothetical protein